MPQTFLHSFCGPRDNSQLRKISIPVHYLYVFVVGAPIGFLSLTRHRKFLRSHASKVSRYNQLRTEKISLENNNSRLAQVAKERDVRSPR